MELIFFGVGLLLGLIVWFWQWRQMRHAVETLLEQYAARPFKSSPWQRLQTLLSQQLQEQARCRQKIQRYQTILEYAPIAYLEVDEANCVVCCNEAARSLFGLRSPEGRLFLELVRSYELDCLIEEVRQEQTITEQEWLYAYITPVGQTKRKPLRARGLFLEEGHVGVFIEDCEEVVRLRDERDRWAADVAHELKTPLTSLRLVTETLQQRVPESLQHWVDRLLAEIIRLTLLVQELLELNRLSHTPADSLERHPLDLVQVIRTAWQCLAPLAQNKNIQHEYSGPDKAPYWGNESQLLRLLMNLYDNAIKHGPVGGQVLTRLLSDREGGYLCLEVIDTGSGFPPKDLPYVFERFYRAQPRRHRFVIPTDHEGQLPPVGSGSGLGLAIARQIVECHGGYIEAANHPDYGGAWLRIYLPLTQL
ncbi:two component signal transduction system controlling phosphate regulon histidine kinase SphS [Thermosynechococcus sp. NK55a]|jgi:two-component system phosphate regulon sensor histidine kinase PhoR|uniref:PAS domain-containing sensor histidine kinase n=1 Tax=Thermosynechococcus sp. NK55a TaxID=1394889 RepID=UPI0003D9143B|nr:PAS domain-containing sensor histidine kinase [Thermosynechococcus sp. NK55a]AHB89478.1 two component signal transduction system controlling phosphate regulon histidine kinase SphS [Thermosynechococcus sp. NK55a]